MTGGHQFWVLLGTDYAGKSSLMAALADSGDLDWRFASYDDRFLAADQWLARRLRNDVEHGLPEIIARYSVDFVLTLVQSAVVFLRDEVSALRADGPVLVDSYYYKFLAKCRLHGLVNDDFFRWWRAFPQPDRVLYLDVSPAVAWRRSGAGAAVNPLETRDHHGGGAAAFEAFQRQLHGTLLEETAGIPLDMLDADHDLASTATAITEMMRSARV